ncbi:MAG TPA: hypothetical protein VLF66_19955, partial [Thermoanaerobaculia bacterium]|nr:hypothetical protein [Thermoanaerobaculia bacterium]
TGTAQSQSVALEAAPAVAARMAEAPPPLRLAEAQEVPFLAELRPAREGAVDQIAAVAAFNQATTCKRKNGFSRPLPLDRAVRLDGSLLTQAAGTSSGGAFVRSADGVVWGAQVRVEDAWRVRLHLSDVHLPRDARMWVYGEGGSAAGPFGLELADAEDGLWTPSVAGPVLRFEVEVPARNLEDNRRFGFRVDRVLELVRLDQAGAPTWAPRVATGCMRDASCFDASDWQVIDQVKHGIAQLSFVAENQSFVCTGGLLNDSDPDTAIPYLLTSNDCISTQASAASLEATWDWFTSSCNDPAPDIDSKPKSIGSTLLRTGASSDFTLLRLNGIPAGRVFLGWNATPGVVGPGTRLHRLSHPAPDGDLQPQAYSRSTGLVADFNRCGVDEGRPLDDPTKFLHHDEDIGGTFSGSYGAPLIMEGPQGWTVGQLWCHCGSDPHEGCDTAANDTLDGAFSNTYQFVSEFIDPAGSGAPPPFATWLRSPDLPGFEAQVRITPPTGGPVQGSRETHCIVETLCASGALAGRPEVFVKIIGPRPNGFLWAQITRFTPSRVEVWLRQLSSGQVNYYNLAAASAGDLTGLEDRTAYQP